MTNSETEHKTLGDFAEDSVAATNKLLEQKEKELIRLTGIDLELFRPKISDAASFELLISAVREANEKNMAVAELKERIIGLGDSVLSVAAEIVAKIPHKRT